MRHRLGHHRAGRRLAGLSARQRGVLLAASAATALVFFDQTAATVALPDIARELHASISNQQWVIGAYLLVPAAIIPVVGRLADLHGRRWLFLAGTAVFGAGSLGCALAPTVEVLIALRAVQGVGAALIVALGIANVTIVMPPELRGWAIGTLGTGGTLFLSLGPLLGGALVDTVGWRWVFAVNLPIVALALLVGHRSLPETREPDPPPLDVAGSVTLVAGLAALVSGLLQMSTWGAGSPKTVAVLAVGVVLLGAFVMLEHRVAHPLVELRLLRRPAVAGALTALAGVQFAIIAVTVELMLYLQVSLGYSPLVAGLLFLPNVLASPLLSPTAGRLGDGPGARRLVGGGLLVAAAAVGWIALVAQRRELALLLPAFVLFGLSRPFIFAPANTAPMTALPAHERGLAGALVAEAPQLGAALGIAVSSVFVASAGAAGGFVGGFQTSMAVSAGVCLVAALASRLLPGRPVHAVRQRARPGRGDHL